MAAKKAKKKTAARSRKKRGRAASVPTDWPASKTEKRALSALIPYARNARTHTKAQVAKIAASIREWGWTNPILIDEANTIIAGHGRVLAAEVLEIETVPVMVARGWTKAQIKAYVIADNRLALDAGCDNAALSAELGELAELEFDLTLTGFGEDEVQGLLFAEAADPLADADGGELPELKEVVVAQRGDLWLLGNHRILCGDSTRRDDVQRLMRDDAPGELAAEASCVIADPPYGMGKERDGIANDNLYREQLDAFQMEWWKIAREHLAENGSVYVWGNAPDLWRLWYVGGLCAAGDLLVRNEIVWNKGAGFGMRSAGQHSFSVGTERCLFLMRGQQFLGNQNKDDYWEGWEPLRAWLVEQRNRAGWKVADVNKLTGTHMAGHWFGKSQFQPISKAHYETLREAADGAAFVEDYDQLFEQLFPELKDGGNAHRRSLSEQVRESRTWFDNTHEAMTDVWEFGRVHGEERYGHATPKPVAMMGRAVKSSVPEGGLIFDPFGGTGTVTIAAELLGRVCYSIELEPAYVDVAIRRWQEVSGEAARLDKAGGKGKTFAAIEGGGR